MTTGKRAFTGKSQASLIHAIMGVDPPAMSSLQVMSPPALDQIVKTCLAPQTPILRVCRVWHRARSSVYARRQATRSPAPCRRRGPIGAAPDDVLFTPPGAWLVATRRGFLLALWPTAPSCSSTGTTGYHGIKHLKTVDLGRLDYRKISLKLVGHRDWVATRYYIGRVSRTNARPYAEQRRFLAKLDADARISTHLGRLDPETDPLRVQFLRSGRGGSRRLRP